MATVGTMLIHQYVYFGVRSDSMSAAEITDWLGLPADEVMSRESRIPEALRPAAHLWKIVCREEGLGVGEQAEKVLGRLRLHEAALRALAELTDDGRPVVRMVLQVVRFFGGESGEEQESVVFPDGSEKLDGQHQLLAWHLSNENLRFLGAIGAALDVDEYG